MGTFCQVVGGHISPTYSDDHEPGAGTRQLEFKPSFNEDSNGRGRVIVAPVN
jgi:hypothetical protein